MSVKGRLHAIVRTKPGGVERSQMILSGRIRKRGLPSLSTLPPRPFAYIGRTINQFDALIFTATQESNDLKINQGDLAKVQNFASATVTHYGPNEHDEIRTKAAAQLEPCGASFGLFFDPQHFFLSGLIVFKGIGDAGRGTATYLDPVSSRLPTSAEVL